MLNVGEGLYRSQIINRIYQILQTEQLDFTLEEVERLYNRELFNIVTDKAFYRADQIIFTYKSLFDNLFHEPLNLDILKKIYAFMIADTWHPYLVCPNTYFFSLIVDLDKIEDYQAKIDYVYNTLHAMCVELSPLHIIAADYVSMYHGLPLKNIISCEPTF